MALDIFTFEDERLRIYLSYDHLRLEQYANLMKAVNGVYESLFHLYSPSATDLDGVLLLTPPPLCIESIETGNSTKISIFFDKKFFFSINPRMSNKGLELHLPRWSAYLAMAGIVLTQVQSIYKGQLEIENLNLQNKKMEMEIQKEFDLQKLQDNKHPKVNSMNMYINLFDSEINQSNIATAEINGFMIKQTAPVEITP